MWALIINLFTSCSTSLDTIDNYVNLLNFHLIINHYSHQILQTSCAESKERDLARDSLGYTLSLMQQLCK